jgi:hypothetical protein
VREMRDGRWEKKMREKKKKCADHEREKSETKLVSEYYSSELVSNFTYQNFLVKIGEVAGSDFLVFSSNWLTKITKKLF